MVVEKNDSRIQKNIVFLFLIFPSGMAGKKFRLTFGESCDTLGKN
jgi:hypothetical protein